MLKKKTVRNFTSIIYTLAVTLAVWKWAVYMAYLERGYNAIGGEYCLTFMVCWIAWKAINYLFDTLEDLEYERHCKKRRDRTAYWMRNNR